jgi:hypothetical protein
MTEQQKPTQTKPLPLGYETPPSTGADDKTLLKLMFGLLPSVLMAGCGWSCMLGAPFLNDSPRVADGALLRICFWMLMLVCPVGLVTWALTYFLAKLRSLWWLLLSWVVFVLYTGTFLVLSHFLMK